MARIRTIKPDFWESATLGRLSPLSRLTFVGLISLADDKGRGRGEVIWLVGRLHSYSSPAVKARVRRSLRDLDEAGLVQFYRAKDGLVYYWIPTFNRHQRIDKPQPSKLPAPPPADEIRGTVWDRSTEEGIKDQGSGKGKEGRGGRADLSANDPPSSEDSVPRKKAPVHQTQSSTELQNELAEKREEQVRNLFKLALEARVPNQNSTIRRYVEAWLDRCGFDYVRETLERREALGRDVTELQDQFFKNGRAPKAAPFKLGCSLCSANPYPGPGMIAVEEPDPRDPVKKIPKIAPCSGCNPMAKKSGKEAPK